MTKIKSIMDLNVKIRELSLFDLFKVKQLARVYFNAFGSHTDAISKTRILYYLVDKKNHFFIIAERERNSWSSLCSHVPCKRSCLSRFYCCE